MDASNNPTTSTANNRTTSAGYSYDLAGNLLCDPVRQCGQSQQQQLVPYYAYDAEDKMVSAGSSPTNGGAAYSYDGDRRRVMKVVGAVTTTFVYDVAGKMVAEYGSDQPQTNGTSYLTQDSLGSTRAVTGQDQSVKGRHDYFPFGEEIPADNNWRNAAHGYNSTDSVRQKFTGKERDNETGLDYFEARYYASKQGRFTSIDPYNIVMERQFATDAKKAESQFTVYLSNPQRWARYTYALNNPLLYTDPHGQDVTIYYRPREEGAGSTQDQGHIFIYVRNDETGESAYYDYVATGDYKNKGDTQLGEVDQARIDAHASVTIETNASQEQAILNGIKAAQNSSPDYSLNVAQGLTHTETTCTSNSIKLLALGGINVGPMTVSVDGITTGMPQTPAAVWENALSQYGNRMTIREPQPRFPDRHREIIPGLDTPPRVGREYGHDPRGQARVLDRHATNNFTMTFRGGRRVQ